MRIRVAIVDDHAVMRAGLRTLINAEPDLETIGEAANGNEAVHLTHTRRPQVLLLDLSMPERSGLQAISAIREASPSTRILVLTMHQDHAYLRAVMAAGGAGYVLKSFADKELLNAIRVVAGGGFYVKTGAVHGAPPIKGTTRPERARRDLDVLTALLSDRERQVLQRVAEGFTNQEIADQLELSVKSVETYRTRVMDKLALGSRAELVRFALDCGLLNSNVSRADRPKTTPQSSGKS